MATTTDTTVIDYKVTGADQAAAATSKIAKEQEKLAKVIAQDNSALAQHTAALKLATVEQRNAAASTEKLTAASRSFAVANDNGSRAVSSLAKATTAGNLGLNRYGETFAKFGGVAASINPEIANLVSTVGRATSATGAFASIIGGPAGVIAGTLLGAFALWGEYTDGQSKKLEALANAQEKVAVGSIKFSDRLAKVTGANAGMDRTDRINRGEGTVDEYQASIGQARAFLKSYQSGSDSGSISDGERAAARSIARLEEQLAQAKARDQINEALASGGNNTGAIGEDISGGGPKSSAYGQQSIAGNQLDEVRAAGDERKRIAEEQLRAVAEMQSYYGDQEKQLNAELLADKRAVLDEQSEAERRAADERMQAIRDGTKEEMELAKEAAEKNKVIKDVVATGVKNVSTASVQSLKALATGRKAGLKEYLATIGDQAVADGTWRVLQGVGEIAGMNYAGGAAMIAAGGAEIAFGMSLGSNTAGARGGPGSTAGRTRAKPAERPAEPQGGRQQASRNTTSNLTVNVSAMVADADAGVRIVKAMNASKAVYGKWS